MLGLPDLTITEINSSLIFETAEKNAGLGKYSGALGLGKPNNSASNFIQLAAALGRINDSKFGFDFASSQFCIGSPSFPVASALRWTDSSSQLSKWGFDVRNLYINNRKVYGLTTNSAYLDFGVSMFTLDSNAYGTFLSNIAIMLNCELNNLTNYWVCLCTPQTGPYSNYPSFGFEASNKDNSTEIVSFNSSEYMLQLNGGYCVLGIQRMESGQEAMVFGEGLFQKRFVAFDQVASKIGFLKN